LGPATRDKTGSVLLPPTSRTSPLLSKARRRHASPGPSSVHTSTPTRKSGAIPRHYYHRNTAGRTAQSSQDEGRHPGRQRRTPPSHSVRPTVSDHCNPAIQGKTTTSMPPLVYTTPPYAYKRRRWVSFSGGQANLSGLDSSLLGLSGSSPQEDAQGLQSTHLHRLHS